MTQAQEPIRVLVADDTATVRHLLRRTLEASTAFEVVGEAVDGVEAVDLAASLRPDMVLLDLSMPVVDGTEAIPRLLQASHATGLQPATGRPSSSQCQRAFEHAPLPMALVGLDDGLLYTNPALCRLTGYGVDELRVRNLGDLTHPDDRGAALAARRAVASGGARSTTVEARLVRPDGRSVWTSISLASAPDGDDPCLVVQMVDISEQKRAERELTRSNAELSSFAYLAAHELKAPLQALSGFAALLDKMYGPDLDPQGREFLSWIADGATRMDSLVEDLLAYCSVDTDETVLTPVALEDVVTEALGQLTGEVTARGAVVGVDPLPLVTGDPIQLVQLLQNLVANALKFVPDGVRPEVHISAERGPDGWTVTVADNGIGVEDGSRERIFTMFERLHPRERFKGTGIGLSICKRIVERRGGTIWVEPNPSGGSLFRFRLPDVSTPTSALPAA